MLALLAFLVVFVCTAATLISIVSVWRLTRAPRRPPEGPQPPVSVLKPLCGADDGLEANLATFFAQRYPAFELVFGVADPADPAVAVALRLIARHPGVSARLVVHDGSRGLNPKVANLRGILDAGSHDLVVISDSNVAVGPDYLARMVEGMAGPRVGAVTSLIAGVGERTLGAALENLHLCGPIAGSVAASQTLRGSALCVGKSVLFRRSLLDRLGGMESLASVLAEDYVMGRMFEEAGYEVRVAATPVKNVVVGVSLKAFMRRQARWGLLRSRLKPLVYPFEWLMSPIAVALVALLLGAEPWVLAWAAGLTFLRDGAQWLRLRGPAGLAAAAPIGLMKDLLLVGAWAAAPFLRHISWRGHRLRVSMGTRLYVEG